MASSPIGTRAFLLACLRQALGDSEVLYDICDVCELSGINASMLASGTFTTASAAERLYLTDSEATAVLEVCRREVANLASATGVSVRLVAGANDTVTLIIIPTSAASSPSPAPEPLAPSPAALFKLLPFLPPVMEDEPMPHAPLTPVSITPPRATSASGINPMAMVYSADCSSPKAFVPSYLRPTSSSTRQTKKEREAAAAREEKPATPKAKKGASIFARLGHTLVAPTATFLARITSKKSHEDNGRALSQSMGSRLLEKVLDSPQGQRVTRPAAFNLAVDARPKALTMSSDDRELAKAQEESFKPNAVPRHVHEARPLQFRAASSPKLPQEVFVPFELASLERHVQQQKEIRLKAEAVKAADVAARSFQAIKWSKDKVGVETVSTPPKPEPQAVTVAKAFTFKSQERAAHYTAVIEPVKKAKEAELMSKDKVEEQRKERELAEMPVSEFRKTLDFKCIKLPDFSAPFRPDAALAQSPTAPRMFALHTTARLGDARPTSAREDFQGHGLAFGAGAFAQSLRGSASGTMMSTAALRRSTQNPLSRSVNGSIGGASFSASLRSTTSTSTQRPAPAASTMNMRNSLNMSLRASLAASLTQGLAEAKLAAAAAACVPTHTESASRRSTHESLSSFSVMAA